MKDYASMSDFEISRLVGDVLGVQWANLDENYHELCYWPELDDGLRIFDPCNNPSDAWPIIMQHKINMTFGDNTPAPDEWGYADAMCKDKNHNEYEWYEKSGNPLRAAMIVFIEMKENEND